MVVVTIAVVVLEEFQPNLLLLDAGIVVYVATNTATTSVLHYNVNVVMYFHFLGVAVEAFLVGSGCCPFAVVVLEEFQPNLLLLDAEIVVYIATNTATTSVLHYNVNVVMYFRFLGVAVEAFLVGCGCCHKCCCCIEGISTKFITIRC